MYVFWIKKNTAPCHHERLKELNDVVLVILITPTPLLSGTCDHLTIGLKLGLDHWFKAGP